MSSIISLENKARKKLPKILLLPVRHRTTYKTIINHSYCKKAQLFIDKLINSKKEAMIKIFSLW